jgi:DNA-binding protein
MSMPEIEICHISRNAAINNVIASIALVETGLSHILNAEGEKLQKALEMYDITFEQLIELNNSVSGVVNGAAALETTLQEKIGSLAKLIPDITPGEWESSCGIRF